MQRLSEGTASSAPDGTRCQPALLYGLLEPLSKHLQVCIPHQDGESVIAASPRQRTEHKPVVYVVQDEGKGDGWLIFGLNCTPGLHRQVRVAHVRDAAASRLQKPSLHSARPLVAEAKKPSGNPSVHNRPSEGKSLCEKLKSSSTFTPEIHVSERSHTEQHSYSDT
ncbi:hypothetical protein EYF80_011347 [Liparis tanakae]|uniref:Uncharacterized protein n=1 Tax=Liparis tanakae TaxID=230148 RepID=A0A4Z2IMI5_9TELE|nr:hypothetical protein EYF80_011347 [Liparis tanakae]